MKIAKKTIVGIILLFTVSFFCFACSNSRPTGDGSYISDSAIDGSGEMIEENLSPAVRGEQILSYKAVSEALYVVFKDTDPKNAEVSYREKGGAEYLPVDKELIRATENPNEARVDVLGLKPSVYSVRIVTGDGKENFVDNLEVSAFDRSGYAHFKCDTGVGAYNNDGTLKSNAKVIYVDDTNKNTVVAGAFKGLGNICTNASKLNFPLAVRFIGRVRTRSWDPMTVINGPKGTYYKDSYSIVDNTKTRDTALNITDIEGLKDKIFKNVDGWDSYFNTLEVLDGTDITFEGVGDDAELFQWGVTFKKCRSVEVRNLEFTDYPEDACAFSGAVGKEELYGNYWIHNNVFNAGKNYWDLTWEQDKHHGDGAIDINNCNSLTYSYNHVLNCHKTGLAGGNDDIKQFNITFHHNYFENNVARTPLARQANMHYYNNYFYNATSFSMHVKSNAYVFSEANYFEECKRPVKVTDTGAVKSFNDLFINCMLTNNATIVESRTQAVVNYNSVLSEKFGTVNGRNFDTDPTLFYYSESEGKSDVAYMTDALKAKFDCLEFAGICKPCPTGIRNEQ